MTLYHATPIRGEKNKNNKKKQKIWYQRLKQHQLSREKKFNFSFKLLPQDPCMRLKQQQKPLRKYEKRNGKTRKFFKNFRYHEKRHSKRKPSESNSILDSLSLMQTFSHAVRKYTQADIKNITYEP